MPVEIKELVIKAVVEEGRPDSANTASTQANIQQELLIQICVEKVLEILKDKLDR